MIKYVTIDNFKAFANPTTIEFSPGTTGIIGPNGSGKSNITDAIKWVMGETSSKNLRGEKMEDVIFNGTEKRKKGDYAEVVLGLDNTRRFFPDIYGDEVRVSRSVIRSKGSEYAINEVSCRLKDIQSLFMDSGIGSRSYSMISQGEISRILSTNKEERRSVFEEAAGIVKLKQNKKKTEEKLSEVEQNLLRYSDIISVMENQLTPLKKQSEKAQKYTGLFEELTTLEVQYLIQEYDDNHASLQEVMGQLAGERSELDLCRTELDSLESTLESVKQTQEYHEQDLFSVQDTLLTEKEKLEKEHSQLLVLEEKVQHAHEKLQTVLSSLKEFEDKFSISSDDLTARQEHLTRLKKDFASNESSSSQMILTISEAEAELLSLRSSQELAKDDSIHTYNELNHRKERNDQLQKERLRLQEDMQQFDAKYEHAENTLAETEQRLLNCETEKTQALSRIQENEQTLSAIEKQTEAARSLRESLNAKLSLLQEEKIKSESEQKYLAQSMENNDGFYEGVKFVLSESKQGRIQGIHGPIASLVHMDEEYEGAVEQLLQSSLQFIVTDTEQAAKTAVELLKHHKKGRATFRPLNLAKEVFLRQNELDAIAATPGIRKAAEVVRFDSKYQPVIHGLLGRSLIADTLSIAISFSKQYSFPIRIATLDGDIVDAASISGGYNKSKNHSLLSKKRSFEKIKEKTQKLTKEIEDVKQDQQAAIEQTHRLTEEQVQLEEQNKEWLYAIKDKETESQYLLKEKERVHETLSSLSVEKEEMRINAEQYADESESLRDKIKQLEQTHSALQQELDQLLTSIEQKEQQLTALQEQKTNLLVESSRLSEEIRQLEHSLADFNLNNKEAKEKFDLLVIRKTELVQEQDLLQAEKEQVTASIASYATIVADLEKVLAEKKQTNTAYKTNIKELEQRISAVRIEKERWEKLVHQSDILLEKNQNAIHASLSRLREGYELDEESIQDIPRTVIDREESKKQVKSLKAQISSLGNINHNAIEEYAALQENFEEQHAQYVDMESAKKDLKNMIQEVHDEMVERFNASFYEIATTFSELFRSFFGGGKAKVELVDKKHPLESAIEIEAAPRGKKPTSIMSLSGGERSLAAVALIFSILKTKPSPFVILDELDAPLDDANIIRFTDHLKEFSKNSQFIVITHRTQTMRVLDYLYGVSQQEEGVSLVVKASFEDVSSHG